MGVVSGILASLWITRSLAALLFGLQPHDLTTFTGAALVLAVVGGFAGWLPAPGRRAPIERACCASSTHCSSRETRVWLLSAVTLRTVPRPKQEEGRKRREAAPTNGPHGWPERRP